MVLGGEDPLAFRIPSFSPHRNEVTLRCHCKAGGCGEAPWQWLQSHGVCREHLRSALCHQVLQVSRPPLLLCQAEVSPALLLSAVSVLLSAPGRTGWGALSNQLYKN